MRQSLLTRGLRASVSGTTAGGFFSSTSMLLDRHTGICKTWIDQKGFGFVTDSANQQDVFVHFREVSAKKPRPLLQVGEQVEFDVEEVDGRLRAVRVTGPNNTPVEGGEDTRGSGGNDGGYGGGRGGGRGGRGGRGGYGGGRGGNRNERPPSDDYMGGY